MLKKSLNQNKNNNNSYQTTKTAKAVSRWRDFIESSQLKEKEYPDSYDSYYSDDYYDLISSYENEFTGGNY